MTRKLRIAVSVFLGLLTLTLCMLWVRSYFVADAIYLQDDSGFTSIATANGSIFYGSAGTLGEGNLSWIYDSSRPLLSTEAYRWDFSGDYAAFFLPLWCLAAITACGIHFSPGRQRAYMLISSITLSAIVWGIGVWLTQ